MRTRSGAKLPTEDQLFPPQEPDCPVVVARKPRRCNELDGAVWLRYSVSVWDDIRKTQEELQTGHPAIFPSMLVRRLIQMFLLDSQKVVLDPFVGSGSTVIGALEGGKQGIGLDTSAEYIETAKRRCASARTFWEQAEVTPEPVLKDGDARDLLLYVEPGSVDLCITSPPYWNILNQKRTADYKAVRHYGNHNNDLGAIDDYSSFLKELSRVFESVFVALQPERYCVIVVMDLRKKDEFYPFHSDIAAFMRAIGYIYDDLIIWDRKAEYNNLRPLGYPSVFRINKVHEYILIFKTPKAKPKSRLDDTILGRIESRGGCC